MDTVNSQVKLWKARKELASIIFERDQSRGIFNGGPLRRAQNKARALQLLRHYPDLARERYLRVLAFRLYPLSFLLQLGADLADVREVYGMNPKVLSQKVYNQVGKHEPDGYPLHLVCGSRHISEDVILFLINQYPQAAKMKNSARELPIHVLLQNRGHAATADEVKALLDATGKDNGACDIPHLLSLAFQNANVRKEVLELLIDRFPPDCHEFHLGGVRKFHGVLGDRYICLRGRELDLTPLQTEAMVKLGARLKTLTCVVSVWHGLAFQSFANALPQQQTLTDLTLTLSSCLLRSKNVLHLDLKKLLQQNTVLQCLHLDFGAFTYAAGNEQVNIAASKRIETLLEDLLAGLRDNHSLKECHLAGGLVNPSEQTFFHSKFWPTLASILEQGNSTLESVSVPKAYQPVESKCTRIPQVLHLIRLNRYGRGKVQDPSIRMDDFVCLLEKAVGANEGPTVRLSTVYGLLSERPSVWSTSCTALEE